MRLGGEVGNVATSFQLVNIKYEHFIVSVNSYFGQLFFIESVAIKRSFMTTSAHGSNA